jgi:hypothetical protein
VTIGSVCCEPRQLLRRCNETSPANMRQLLVALILTLSSLISTSLCACKTSTDCTPHHPNSPPTNLCAASATSFCKCTCKGNSTIIALNPKTSSFSSSSSPSNSPHLSLRRLLRQREEKAPEVRQEAEGDGDENREKTHRANTCNDCNRKFCLDYNLPGCKGVRAEEVFTTCFRMQIPFLPLISTGKKPTWFLPYRTIPFTWLAHHGGPIRYKEPFQNTQADGDLAPLQSAIPSRTRRWSSYSSLLRRDCSYGRC